MAFVPQQNACWKPSSPGQQPPIAPHSPNSSCTATGSSWLLLLLLPLLDAPSAASPLLSASFPALLLLLLPLEVLLLLPGPWSRSLVSTVTALDCWPFAM
jgi:hypothetical protein